MTGLKKKETTVPLLLTLHNTTVQARDWSNFFKSNHVVSGHAAAIKLFTSQLTDILKILAFIFTVFLFLTFVN